MADRNSTGDLNTSAHPSTTIEEQRQRLFRAMNLVGTTALSCDEGDSNRKGTLEAAHEIMNDVAAQLEAIGSAL
jgi:hypothetical protein